MTHQITLNVLTAEQSEAKQSPLLKLFLSSRHCIPCKEETLQIESVGLKKKKKTLGITDSLPIKAYVHSFQWEYTKTGFYQGLRISSFWIP